MHTEAQAPSPNGSSEPSLADMLNALLAAGKAHQEAKKKTKKISAKNSFKEAVVTKDNTGSFQIETIDRRLADPRWETANRVMLVRKVTCLHCGVSHVAPNEVLMVRKTHPKYGMIEEALSPHEAKYDHLPVIIEQINSRIAHCQNCVNYIKVSILPETAPATIPTNLDELFQPGTMATDGIIEEPLDEDEIGWEDPINLASLEDF